MWVSISFLNNLYYSWVRHPHSFLHDLKFGIFLFSFYCFSVLLIILFDASSDYANCSIAYFLFVKMHCLLLLNSANEFFCFFKIDFRGSLRSFVYSMENLSKVQVSSGPSILVILLCYKMFFIFKTLSPQLFYLISSRSLLSFTNELDGQDEGKKLTYIYNFLKSVPGPMLGALSIVPY